MKASGVEIQGMKDNKTYEFKNRILLVCASSLTILDKYDGSYLYNKGDKTCATG